MIIKDGVLYDKIKDMKLTELKRKHKNKWVLAQVLKEDKMHNMIEVKPLVVSADRNKVYQSLNKLKKGAHVATIYTGQAPPKGLVFAFNVNSKV